MFTATWVETCCFNKHQNLVVLTVTQLLTYLLTYSLIYLLTYLHTYLLTYSLHGAESLRIKPLFS